MSGLRAWATLILLPLGVSFTTVGALRFRSYKLYSTKSIVVAPSKRSVPSEQAAGAILKVPSNAWKWPTSWLFPKDFTVRIEEESELHNGGGERFAALNEIFSEYIQNGQPLGQPNTLVISTDAVETTHVLSHINVDTFCNSSGGLFPIKSGVFDRVVFRSGVELIENPVEVFQEIWRVLKPSGQCYVCFSDNFMAHCPHKPLKMWHTMNDEQKMWIAGSYFHYSAFDGWKELEGYDLLGTTGKSSLSFENTSNHSAGKPRDSLAAYVVQARKADYPPLELVDTESQPVNATSEAVFSRIVGLRHASIKDKRSLARRVAALIRNCENVGTDDHSVDALLLRLDSAVPPIYRVLQEVTESVMPVPAKSLLCTLLLPKWTGSAAQLSALRAGLGLPSAEDSVAGTGSAAMAAFWASLAKQTDALSAKDKLYVLADLVPALDCANCEGLATACTVVLEEVQAALTARLPANGTSRLAIQRCSVDLLVADFLGPLRAQSSRQHAAPSAPSPQVVEQLKNRLVRFVQSASIEELLSPATAGG